jgi:hypothetical protein
MGDPIIVSIEPAGETSEPVGGDESTPDDSGSDDDGS